MSSERMSGADAAWLHMDRPENLMIVNTVLWFDTTPDWTALLETVQARLVDRHLRFRQRAVDPPVTLGPVGPTWAEVDSVHVTDHLVRAALPAPGDLRALHAYVADQARYPLDEHRPRWELHTIDGFGDGAALLLRTHHAIGDGRALVEVITGLTDPVDDPAPSTDGGIASASARGALDDPGDVVGDLQALARLSGRLLHWPGGSRAPLTGTKVMTWSGPIPLSRLKDAGRPTGSTVNDVVLSAVAGALRSLGAPPHRDLDVVVPIDLRPPGPADELGNHFGLAFMRLPVASEDPAERLAVVSAQMRRIKSSREGAVVLGSLGVLGHTPGPAQRAWVDAFTRDAVAVVTNVRGPGERVALAGTAVAGMSVWVPSTGPLGIGVSVVSYAGDVMVGLVVDEGVVPHDAHLAEALDAELVRRVAARR